MYVTRYLRQFLINFDKNVCMIIYVCFSILRSSHINFIPEGLHFLELRLAETCFVGVFFSFQLLTALTVLNNTHSKPFITLTLKTIR